MLQTQVQDIPGGVGTLLLSPAQISVVKQGKSTQEMHTDS